MTRRRTLLSSIGTVGTITIAGCSGDTSNDESDSDGDSTSNDESDSDGGSDITVQEIKSQADEIEYDSLMRNSDQYQGQYVHSPTGQVTQVLGEEGQFQFRIYVSEGEYSWEDDVLVRWNGKRFLEDDFVEFWGEFTGLITYETALGSERTIPDVTAVDIEIIEQETEPESTKEDIEITEHELIIEEGEYTTDVYVEGIVTNSADNKASSITIGVVTYDSDGNQLENYNDYTSDLPSNETWAFKIDIFEDPSEFDEYEIAIDSARF
jgi:hypothetical protein